MTFRLVCITFLTAGVLAISGCGPAQTENVSVSSNLKVNPTPTNEVEEEISYPLIPPDAAEGEALYQQKCAPCHGVTGNGAGPQASNLPIAVPALSNAELARSVRPVSWFSILSKGNLPRMMPGFAGSLTERQRWDVVAYLFSLSTSQAELEQGKGIYQQKCTACHGEKFFGDGPEAVRQGLRVPDWSQPARLTNLSGIELRKAISEGSLHMPAFHSELSEEQSWAVTSYIRRAGTSSIGAVRLNLPVPSVPGVPTQTPEAASKSQKLLVTGKISWPNVEQAARWATGATVELFGYDGVSPTVLGSTPLVGDRYSIEVELNPAWTYLAQLQIDAIPFQSDIIQGQDISGNQADLPIRVYAITHDPSNLVADRLHIFFDFPSPDVLRVVELFLISNPSEQVVAASESGKPVLEFLLPDGADNLVFEDGELGQRYIKTEKGFGDTLPVTPGKSQTQMVFSYDLPFNQALNLPVFSPLPVSAIVVMVPEDEFSLQSPQLKSGGQKTIQGTTVQLYLGGNLKAGASLDLSLHSQNQTNWFKTVGTAAPAWAGLAFFILAAIGVAAWGFLTHQKDRQPKPEQMEEILIADTQEALLDAIITLDDQFRAGELPEDAYRMRRAELKQRLLFVMKQGA